MVRPDSLQKITDDDIRKAFENEPQLVKPLTIAVYSVGSTKTSFTDSLRKMDFVKNVYEISPALVEGDSYYSHRYRGWYPAYSSPPTTDIKKLRLLAAQGKADLLVVSSTSHFYSQSANFLAYFYVLLVTAFFVPGVDAELMTEVDLIFVDVRNGFLYGTYHDENKFKNRFVNLSYSEKTDKLAQKQAEVMVPDMVKTTREILTTPDFYLGGNK
jgi:hypothetical protein